MEQVITVVEDATLDRVLMDHSSLVELISPQNVDRLGNGYKMGEKNASPLGIQFIMSQKPSTGAVLSSTKRLKLYLIPSDVNIGHARRGCRFPSKSIYRFTARYQVIQFVLVRLTRHVDSAIHVLRDTVRLAQKTRPSINV